MKTVTVSRSAFCRILLLALLAAGTSAAPLCAQDDDSGGEAALEKGAWALQFQIGPDATLRSFQGGTISAKKHLSADRALRFGITVDGRVDRSDGEQRSEQEEGTIEVRDEVSRSGIFLGLSGQYLRYASPARAITFYYGGGPEAFVARSSREEEETASFGGAERMFTRSSADASLRAGLGGVVGAEWFVRDDLSLSAEYAVALAYQHARSEVERRSPDEPERTDVSERTSNSVRFGSGGVRVGLSLYF